MKNRKHILALNTRRRQVISIMLQQLTLGKEHPVLTGWILEPFWMFDKEKHIPARK
jgi:hypothetical protein